LSRSPPIPEFNQLKEVEARERWLQIHVIVIMEAVIQAENPLGPAGQVEEQGRFQNIMLGANMVLLSSTRRVGVAVQNEFRKKCNNKPKDGAEREPVVGTSQSAQINV
jgi:hypothetical protein